MENHSYINNQFVLYELAVKLKELGFDEPCIATISNIEAIHIKGTRRLPSGAMCTEEVNAPLWQQAFKFIQSKIDLYEQGLELTLTSKDWILTDGTYYKSKNEKALMRLITLVEDEK